MQGEIEKARLEYETKHGLVFSAIGMILKTMNENRKSVCTACDGMEIKDEKGNPILIELDFWSEGEYGKLERRLEALSEKVKKGLDDPGLSTADLDEVLKEAEKINLRQRKIVHESIEKGNAAQIRAVVADTAIENLKKQLFEVIEQGYETNDQRKGYIVKLRNETLRTNLLLLIYSDEKDLSKIMTKVVTEQEGAISESVMERRALEINKSLREAGIEIPDNFERMNEESVRAAIDEIYNDRTVLKSKERGGREISNETLRKTGLRRAGI